MSLQGSLSNLCPRSVLITGSNRGIGLQLVKQLVKLPAPPKYIFATCRNAGKASVSYIIVHIPRTGSYVAHFRVRSKDSARHWYRESVVYYHKVPYFGGCAAIVFFFSKLLIMPHRVRPCHTTLHPLLSCRS